MILAIRTDNPQAELFVCKGSSVVDEYKWQAHRQLADTIHIKIKKILENNHIDYQDLTGLVVFKGPGSFTGLRIGLSVFNTIASSLNIPIVGTSGDDWLEDGLLQIKDDVNQKIIIPNYGGEANISKPKK
jgi:tRNA threonylcarbamoyladenosine biosynthesis protein TsaB